MSMPEGKGTGFFQRWGPALVMMALIFAFSSIPMREVEVTREGFRLTWRLVLFKGGHILGYALLAAAFRHGLKIPGWRGAAAVLGMTLAYAISDELHQAFVPGRSASIMDVVIDMIGAAVGLGLTQKKKIFTKKRSD